MTVQRIQYNGMLLLASYIQRLHVYYATLQHVEQKQFEQLQRQKEAFSTMNAIMPMFEQTGVLTVTQFEKLQQLTDEAIEAMAYYFKPGESSLEYKVAIVTSTLFSEQLMNNGILHMGKLYKETINSDFEKRVPFYEQRTKMMQIVVQLLKDGQQPEPNIVKIIDQLFEGIEQREQLVLQDLAKISSMLKGEVR